MRSFACVVFFAACSALDQFPIQMPFGGQQMGLGQMPFGQMPLGMPQMPMGMPQMPQMPMGMPQMPQMPMGMPQMPFGQAAAGQAPFGMPQMQFGQMPAQISLSKLFGQFQGKPVPVPAAKAAVPAPEKAAAAPAPEKAAAAPAPVANPDSVTEKVAPEHVEAAKVAEAPAAVVAPVVQSVPAPAAEPAVAAPQPEQPQVQIADIAKWAQAMGMPQMSNDDLTKLVSMQNSMVETLRALPEPDVNQMRVQQNELADEMDAILKNPTDDAVNAFQSKQESLMNSWAARMGLPPVSPQEHELMRSQVHKMFQQISALPKSDLDVLRQKHVEIKKMMQQQ